MNPHESFAPVEGSLVVGPLDQKQKMTVIKEINLWDKWGTFKDNFFEWTFNDEFIFINCPDKISIISEKMGRLLGVKTEIYIPKTLNDYIVNRWCCFHRIDFSGALMYEIRGTEFVFPLTREDLGEKLQLRYEARNFVSQIKKQMEKET